MPTEILVVGGIVLVMVAAVLGAKLFGHKKGPSDA